MLLHKEVGVLILLFRQETQDGELERHLQGEAILDRPGVERSRPDEVNATDGDDSQRVTNEVCPDGRSPQLRDPLIEELVLSRDRQTDR